MSELESNNLPVDAPVPRLCHLFKWPDFDGFGFNLQVGHFIGKVDEDSPAQHADLREGDRIIEVNGVPISNENHKQVVQRIKAVSDETHLLVINQDDYFWYEKHNLIIRSTQSNVRQCTTPVPRPTGSKVSNGYTENDVHQMNGKPESITNDSANVSLNTSNNQSIKESTTASTTSESKSDKTERRDSSLDFDRLSRQASSNQNSDNADDLANKLKSSVKLQNESNTIESNNNSEKTANQNLVQNSDLTVLKASPQKTHNFIVVNSEADFAAEKRLKDEQKNSVLKNSTPIKGSDSSKIDMNNHQMNLSITSSVSSMNNNNSNHTNSSSGLHTKDINLNMSASEMRKLIASRRNVKAECKKATMDLRQKYEIIQQM